MIPVVRNMLLTPQGIVRDGLVAWYKFDEGSGQVLTDYSPYGNHGVLGSTSGADTNDPTWTAQGLSFITDDYVNVPYSASLDFSTAFYIETVIKTGASLSGYLFCKNVSLPADIQYGAYIDGPYSRIGVWLNGDERGGSADGSIAVNTPYVIGVGYDSRYICIHINKTRLGYYSYTDPLNSVSTSLRIGGRKVNAVFLNGLVLSQAYYNRMLSLAEIARNYEAHKKTAARRGIALP